MNKQKTNEHKITRQGGTTQNTHTHTHTHKPAQTNIK